MREGDKQMPGVTMEELARASAGGGIQFEYEVLRAKANVNADNVVSGVKGIEDTAITSKARQGWRVLSASWSGRKLVAVLFERPKP